MTDNETQLRTPHHSVTRQFLRVFGTGRTHADVPWGAALYSQMCNLEKMGYVRAVQNESFHAAHSTRFLPTCAGHVIVFLYDQLLKERKENGQ